MKENPLLHKTFAFAVRAFNVSKYLREQKNEYIISKQLARCCMSIGANAEEGNAAQSKKEFASKLQISYKEAIEAHYWVRLLEATNQLSLAESKSLKNDIEEILILLTAILKTTNNNLKG
jgi:four helix bundle protein